MIGRTLEELITLHELEPELCEVITEGRVDSSLIGWFLSASGRDVPVYAVTDLLDMDDIRNATVAGSRVNGNRDALIAAAEYISRSAAASKGVTFIIDADYDHMLARRTSPYPHLLVTDYTALEIYCFNAKVLGKYLRVVLRAPREIAAESILTAITDSLIDLFAIRWILHNAKGSPRVVTGRRVVVDGNRVKVDVESILKDSINAASTLEARDNDVAQLLEEYNVLRGSMNERPEYCVNGHDFPEILCLFLRRKHARLFGDDRKLFKTPDVARNALLGCLEVGDLSQQPMFVRLLERIS